MFPAPSDLIQQLRAAPRDLELYRACRDYAGRFDGENDFDSYTNGELKLLMRLLPDCRVVFDVGAHHGGWTEAALAINAALTIHAFEPSRDSYAVLSGKDLPPAVTRIRAGLGERDETRTLYTLGDDAQLRSLYRREGLEDDFRIETPREGETVTITTLDSYCRSTDIDAIDFLKIDTEGHDLRVLRGGTGLIDAGRIRFIQFEYGQANVESRDLLKDFFQFFTGRPYNLHKIHPDGFSHHPRYNVRLENFQYQNWLAVRQA